MWLYSSTVYLIYFVAFERAQPDSNSRISRVGDIIFIGRDDRNMCAIETGELTISPATNSRYAEGCACKCDNCWRFVIGIFVTVAILIKSSYACCRFAWMAVIFVVNVYSVVYAIIEPQIWSNTSKARWSENDKSQNIMCHVSFFTNKCKMVFRWNDFGLLDTNTLLFGKMLDI